MLNEILNLEGVAVLSKEQQKSVNGGVYEMDYWGDFSGQGETDGCSGPTCSSDADCSNICMAGSNGRYKEYCAILICPTSGYKFAKQFRKTCSC